MDEASARRVVLARAIETADAQPPLLAPDERARIDREARKDAVREHLEGPVAPEAFIRSRADRVLAVAGVREPGLLAAIASSPWPGRVAGTLPLLAFLAGVASDLAGNPHRVDLVSLPVLGLVLWNIAIYLVVVASALRRPSGKSHWLSSIAVDSDGERTFLRRTPNAKTQALAAYGRAWSRLGAPAEAARWERVLHLCAAAWALGLLASLAIRGLVVEYRVGWESTFLGPAEVHAILVAMRWPAALLHAFPPVTVDDVAALHFSAGGGVAAGGRDWVGMVAALMAVVVLVPRLVLAAVARWRESRARRNVTLPLDDPYYTRIAALLDSERLTLGLLESRQGDRAWLERVLGEPSNEWPVLATTEQGDTLVISALRDQSPVAPKRARRWPWSRDHESAVSPRAAVDAVLAVVQSASDRDAARRRADEAAVPLLALVRADASDGGPVGPDVLPEADFAQCWVQEPAFFSALARVLPPRRRPALERIAQARLESRLSRLRVSMQAAADHLVDAARQQETLQDLPGGIDRFLPAGRDVHAAARQRAMAAIGERVRESGAKYVDRLRQLHGLTPAEVGEAEHRLEARWRIETPIDAPQAGMAGAATGAAMGASVDLVTGGLTLGAAAALGAVLGGGAGYVGAWWKNRSSPGGATVVQVSDEMLLALAEAAVMRYLAVVHALTGGAEGEEWLARVAKAIGSRGPVFAHLWQQARAGGPAPKVSQPVAQELYEAVREVLAEAYSASSRLLHG